eukprot:XP_011675031.1 PREDICTED: uncharacterized protein LOC105443496 [Strongylocentrotus purpuratus]
MNDQSNCQNGGECTSSGQPCNCPAGFTGDLCQNASQGLSNGAIIGIALGVFGFVLVLITCVCCVFVQGVRQNQATKLMLAEQRYENPSRQNRGFYGNESFNGCDETFHSLLIPETLQPSGFQKLNAEWTYYTTTSLFCTSQKPATFQYFPTTH